MKQIEALPVEVLTCQQVAPLLGANPATIHGQAMERPEMLGFPVICAGRRVKIPKRPFIRFMREGDINTRLERSGGDVQ